MQRCRLCGMEGDEEDFCGPYCLRCDKIVADSYADLNSEF
jgi:hypothetical protein